MFFMHFWVYVFLFVKMKEEGVDYGLAIGLTILIVNMSKVWHCPIFK